MCKHFFSAMRLLLVFLLAIVCVQALSQEEVRAEEVIPRSEWMSSGENTVQTSQGTIQGSVYRTARAFYAIPYAQPPVGNLRFSPPVAAGAFNSTPFVATMLGPGCPQDCELPPYTCTLGTSEDCLHLDVYTPRGVAANASLPVVVFIHGGNFIQGGTGTILYNADFIANNSRVVVVNIQYRLGALGFYFNDGEVPGNLAILDQNLALTWVQKEISAFGGDPTQVTIWGQSAGGSSVMSHMISPTSKDLFHAAAMDSNPITLALNSKKEATELSNRFAQDLGCAANDLACLRQQSLPDIIAAQNSAIKIYLRAPLNAFMPWQPMIDGQVIPMQPMDAISTGNFNHVPFITGTVNDEALMFIYSAFTTPLTYDEYLAMITLIFGKEAPRVLARYPVPADQRNDTRPVVTELGTDYIFLCPVRHIVREISNQSVPTWYYHFDHAFTQFNPWGPGYPECVGYVCHGSELPYIFNSAQIGHRITGYVWSSAEAQLAAQISTYWGNFVTSQNPNQPASQPLNWPAYQQSADQDLKFATPSSVETGYRQSNCDFWDSLGYTYGN